MRIPLLPYLSSLCLGLLLLCAALENSAVVVLADPILAPELKYCHLPLNLPDEEIPFDCCAPNWDKPAIDFQLNESDRLSVRVRKPAHQLDEAEAARLDKAYGLMRAMPDEDPRSFKQQANIHCAYCSAAYQMGNSSTPLQVHSSWLFFSFHRWYLYFHERILAHLLEAAEAAEAAEAGGRNGEAAFALPFWNYDHPDGMTIPFPFVRSGNLTDRYRDPSRLPPATVMIDYYYQNASIRTHGEQIAANLAAFHRMVVSGATTQYAFHGQPYRQGDPPEPGYGTVETMPHNSVHGWTGDHAQVGGKDMGTLYAAGRDPVFYAHHANMDRLWEAWKSLGNTDISDPDYLRSEYVFYNEHAELVKVSVKDCLDPIKLGFTYADVENLWINATLPATSSGPVVSLSDTDTVCSLGQPLLEPCSVVLARDMANVNAYDGEEMILLEGIEGVLDAPTHFEAFVNLPQANTSTAINCAEFVGRFSTLPQAVYTNMTGNYRNTSVRFPIGENIRSLDLSGQESVILTIVPRVEVPYAALSVKSIGIYYETEGLSSKRLRGSNVVA